jgi:prepilin-type N-terminal cleavage/methylation domain-containing protein
MNTGAILPACARPRRRRGAFTLLEVMIVLAILALVLGVGVPALFSTFRREPMRDATKAFMEACHEARAQAILQAAPTELVIRPGDRTLASRTVAAAPAPAAAGPAAAVAAPPPAAAPSAVAATWPEEVGIELLDVNFVELKDAEEARVRFYANGTSDEFTVVLRSSDNQWRKLSLEVTTALADYETDPRKWQ